MMTQLISILWVAEQGSFDETWCLVHLSSERLGRVAGCGGCTVHRRLRLFSDQKRHSVCRNRETVNFAGDTVHGAMDHPWMICWTFANGMDTWTREGLVCPTEGCWLVSKITMSTFI